MNNILNNLTKLVAADSRTGSERAITPLFKKLLEDSGFSVEVQEVSEGQSNLYAVKNDHPKSKATLFYGHQDTVAPAQGWGSDPFELRCENGRLYGLGAFDMKGGIAAFLEATHHTTAYVKIFLAVDEEEASQGAWYAAQNNEQFFQDVGLVVSAEPSLVGGSSHITIGRTGRFLFDVVFQGKSVHLANYQDGVDAIERMQKFLGSFYTIRHEMFDAHGSTAQIRSVQSGVVGMSVPEAASCQVEVLAAYGEGIEGIQAKLQQLAGSNAQVAIAPRKTPYLSGYHNSTFLYQDVLEQTIRRVYNEPVTYIERKSVGDDNVLASLGLPVITWGPEGGNAHTADEWVSVTSLDNLRCGYETFLNLISSRSLDN